MANLNLQGIDVSNHQPDVNWDAVKAAGVDFAMCKVSQAATYQDPQWNRNRSEARRVGIAVGGYHFFRWDVDALAQAQFFVRCLGEVLPGDLPPCVDIENVGDGAGSLPPANMRVSMVRTFIDYVDAHLPAGRKCMIYSYPDMWRNYMGNSSAFTNHPLWPASYKSGSPALFGGWAKYTLWQTSSTGRVPGVPGIVDLDVFNGTAEEWAALTQKGEQGGSTKAVYFEETKHKVSGGFLDFFLAHGEVQIFGYPLTEEMAGTNGTWSGTVQWFERACFEWHTESGQGVVMLRNLGAELAPEV